MGRQPALSFKGLARFGVPKDSGEIRGQPGRQRAGTGA